MDREKSGFSLRSKPDFFTIPDEVFPYNWKIRNPVSDFFPHSEHKLKSFLIFSFPKSPLWLFKAWLRKGKAFSKGKSLLFPWIPSPALIPPSPDPACVRFSLEKELFHSLSAPAMARRVFLQFRTNSIKIRPIWVSGGDGKGQGVFSGICCEEKHPLDQRRLEEKWDPKGIGMGEGFFRSLEW